MSNFYGTYLLMNRKKRVSKNACSSNNCDLTNEKIQNYAVDVHDIYNDNDNDSDNDSDKDNDNDNDSDNGNESEESSNYFHDSEPPDIAYENNLTEEENLRNKELKEYFSKYQPQISDDSNQYASYDIIELIIGRIKRAVDLYEANRLLPQHFKITQRELLYEDCNLTVDEFKCEYRNFVSSNNLSDKTSLALFDFIKRVLPSSNNYPSKIDNTIIAVQTDDKEISADCDSVFEMENCDCGQTIYIAENINLTNCHFCKANRYGTSGDDRYPISLMNYRSIIITIFQLLQTKEFYDAVQNVVFSDFRENYQVDVMDGPVAKQHMEEMNEKWKQNSPTAKPLNLLLCLQYDGAQLFNSSVTNFWPMLITILNLPPPLRKEIGVGTFLISLFTAYSKSVSEKFLFNKQLIPELQKLYEGFVLYVNGEKYCIQARLILHCYDSRALESVLKVHGAGSEMGCSLCRLIPGWGSKKEKLDECEEIEEIEQKKPNKIVESRNSKSKRQEYVSLLPSMIYAGHRCMLPMTHWLRLFGQSGQCCPILYYHNKSNKVRESFIKSGNASLPLIYDCKRLEEMKHKCCGNTIIEYGTKFTFYCDESDIHSLKDYLYYHHCDLRPYVPYRRISNDQFLEDAKRAHEENSKPVNRKRKTHKSKKNALSIKDRSKEKSVNGVKGIWAFAVLAYVNISRSLSYDSFHTFKNIITYLLHLITGKRTMKPIVRTFCKNTASHPSLYSQTGAIWQLSKSATLNIENRFFKSVVLSKGYASHLKIHILFSQMGNINGKEMINIFDWAMDFICYAIQCCETNYPYAYLLYYCMFSKLISDLLAPVVDGDEIENLHNRVIEMVCLHEGLFPVSETHMVFHQLIDIPYFMKEFGPLRGWWTLPSERAISSIKQNLNRGNNRKYYRRVYRREFIKEYLKANDKYSSNHNLYSKDSTIEIKDEVSFSDFRTKLGKDRKREVFNAFQIKEYLQFMLNELNTISSINNELHSPLLRLQHFFLKIHKLNLFCDIKFTKNDFTYFLEVLSNSEAVFPLVEDDNYDNSEVDEVSWNEIKNERKLFKKDFEFVKRIFSRKYIFDICNTAYIWGIQFQGRGSDYYEENEPTDNRSTRYGIQSSQVEYFPSNRKNDWKRNGNTLNLTSQDVSSLCLVRKPSLKPDKPAELHFCQINNFSVVKEPMEPLLKGISFAIVVTRDAHNVTFKCNRTFENLYESELKFVPNPTIVNIKDIYPCPLAVVSTEDTTPMQLNETESNPNKLIFFLLHRNRAILIDNNNLNSTINKQQ